MKGATFVVSLLLLAANLANVSVVTPSEKVTPGSQEPHPEQLFGAPNPSAPEELTQFEFLIGEHECVDELTDLDGKTTRIIAHRSGRYILNGYGIQDSYWNELFSTTNVRVYDVSESKWFVSYFRQPNFKSGVWTGAAEGSKLKLSRTFDWDGIPVESLLTFQNITLTSFKWTSEYVSADTRYTNWTSTCERRR